MYYEIDEFAHLLTDEHYYLLCGTDPKHWSTIIYNFPQSDITPELEYVAEEGYRIYKRQLLRRL